MNFRKWLSWRWRVPQFSDERAVQLGQAIAWKATPSFHKRVKALPAGLSASDAHVRSRLWIIEWAAWDLAAQSTIIQASVLDRFFTGLWDVAVREMRADLPKQIVIDRGRAAQDVSRLVDKLLEPVPPGELGQLTARLGSAAGALGWARSKVLSEFVRQGPPAREASELTSLGIEFAHRDGPEYRASWRPAQSWFAPRLGEPVSATCFSAKPGGGETGGGLAQPLRV